MRTVFLGTPDWAVPSLEALAGSKHRPALVVTQPARRRGRGLDPSPSSVGAASARLGIEWIAPESAAGPAAFARLSEPRPDMIVVVAYGEILPKVVLDLPRMGCVNLHFSLLPRYRGAAPVQWAIANGETETGVTSMSIEAKLDAGPIYMQERTRIAPEEHAPALGVRLAALGASVLVATLDGIDRGALSARPQEPREVTYARMLGVEDGWIDWALPAEAIARRVRGFDPWPGQSSASSKGRLKILQARASRETAPGAHAPPGTVLNARGDACMIVCGEGTVLDALLIRSEGRRSISGAEALRGRQLAAGERLGGAPILGA